ncbi:potassium channel subfamily K member 13-like [Tubulanus polymorphus]|uniref:potassium channel subfamily K member 13-like n=1 Tax=Tubulanus polymorphus TaxID=672921 RepID=UPI003DA362D6
MSPRDGCCSALHLKEDNARFILLALVMVIYMLSGASVFMFLERENELNERSRYHEALRRFLDNNPRVNETELQNLLKHHADASIAGIIDDKRERWDFSGSFYFVGTVVSTIGFGMTTPRTIPGKIVLIFYGFLGCAGAILFFNLFLERIITFLAYILRSIHERELRRKGLMSRDPKGRRGSQVSDDDSLDSWKPSVYWVMIILFLGAVVIACCASAMYYPVENWSYFEAIYFCFVTFATIGFGDYVVSQGAHYDNVHLYRFGNFIFIVLGCCCIYSLFNVTSIVIKQFLNWLIKKLDCRCCYKPKPRPRRNAITPGHLSRSTKASDANGDADSYDSDIERRGSGEMISMRDFLQANKISLAMMQKQLYETAQRGAFQQNGGGFQGGVGPLAILNKKLGQDDT